ncbi:uncharacterized protein LOC116139890 [Pistacia vera]|uniref:uncharacterized protein LOC116139890 n=1 Tax=Pistacia vera TaxID=55513 RepID=UPI001262B995|nr:uncharacterized protein LOC116139890 [Pistacia vera]
MSWLARSLANSLRLDDEENDGIPHRANLDPSPTNHDQIAAKDEQTETQSQSLSELEEDEAQSRGVKEDLTEFKQTLTRQFWGVASFLAPPPSTQDHPVDSNRNLNESELSDLSDKEDPENSGISDRFRSGVSEISKMASNYFPFGSEDNEEQIREDNEEQIREDNVEEQEEEGEEEELSAVGITDEVLAFARNIAHHPETWLDYPLDEEEDLDDFDMSDAQKEHVFVIQHLAPRLAALRIELCPCHMSENYFWKVYFVLLHSRLNKHDAEVLSTLQVVEARTMWMQELQKQTKPETDWFGRSTSYMKDSTNVLQEHLVPTSSNYAPSDVLSLRTYASELSTSTMIKDYETEKHPIDSTEIHFVDKSVIAEKPVAMDKNLTVGPSSKIQIPNYEDDEDDWPEEDSDLGGYNDTAICVGNEDDISFSDLEDDGCVPIKPKIV